MSRKKAGKTGGKKGGAGPLAAMRPLLLQRRVVMLAGLALLLLAGGCSLTPREYYKEPPGKSTGLKALDDYAWDCYELGLDYMDQSRYELARQQFSLAASSAVSRTLHADALDAMRRAEQNIRQQR
ncbi:MAG: hypothetical protein AB1461_03160 [Thermodesulfobacteriota bacterium]